MNDDLISRGKLKKHYAWWRETENGRKMADLFDEIVDAQPPAEVPDRKVGKVIWVYSFEDGTELKLSDVGFSAEEIWKLEEIHGRCFHLARAKMEETP